MRISRLLGVAVLAGLSGGGMACAAPSGLPAGALTGANWQSAPADDGMGGTDGAVAPSAIPAAFVAPPPPAAPRAPDGEVIPVQAPAVQSPSFQTPNVTVAPIARANQGVLTPQGVLVVDPSIQYQHTSVNTFVAGGVAILDTILIGNIQATQAKRDAITGTLAFRYGIIDRLEAEVRVPYMYRRDSVTNTVVSTNNAQQTTDLSDHDLGDVEAALHYQINEGSGSWPIFVGNLRAKSDTGRSPFEVKRDAMGIPQELATGSGFWGVEPSITMIVPSDPAVFFANAGYLYNVPTSVNKPYNSKINIKNVDPGGAIRIGLGMGIALNEKISLSLGYQEDFLESTKTKFSNGSTFKSGTLNVGTLNLGATWQVNEKTAVNFNLGMGVTNDAPDVTLTARVPISVDLFR